MSTETQFGAPSDHDPTAAPSHTFAPAQSGGGYELAGDGYGLAGSAAFRARRAGTAYAPAQGGPEDEGGISWDRPTSGDLAAIDAPQPRLRQLIGVCGWAAVLGGLGLVIGIRGFIGDLMGHAPGWYEPSMIIVGIAGIGLTVSAFVTVHRNRLPFAMLGGATVLLLVALILTVAAF